MQQPINYEEAIALYKEKLGISPIMQMASSLNDHVSVRTVSCILYEDEPTIYFKTDINFKKTQQILANPQVAICKYNVTVEGTIENKGLVVDEPGRKFEKMYERYLAGSYNAYSHEDTEILLAIHPKLVQIWDTDENNYGFQIFIDFEKKEAYKKIYDVYK